MIEHDRTPVVFIDLGFHLIAETKLAIQQGAKMKINLVLLLRIGNSKYCFITDFDSTDIPDLPARLCIKWSSIENDYRLVTIFKLINGNIVLQNRQYFGLC